MPSANAPLPGRPSMFSRGFRSASSSRRSESTADRPPSSRSSFVEKLRNMQLTPSLQSRNHAHAASRISASVRPPSRALGRSVAPSTAAPLRQNLSSNDPFGRSSQHIAQTGMSPMAPRVSRHTPTPPASSAHEPTTSGVRGKSVSLPPRGPIKLPPRDTSPVKTYKPVNTRKAVNVHSSHNKRLRVAITLMTRKPHRFDWYVQDPWLAICA